MDKNEQITFKIGEASRRAGVNKTTVRYYEKRGLISKPNRRRLADRSRSGYRIFTKQHISQLKFIKRAQKLGFTLSEIKELLELRMDKDSTCSQIKREAQQKYRNVDDKIKDLQRINTTLIDLIASCDDKGPKGDCPILEALEGEGEVEKGS